MGKIFDMDSPLMRFLNRTADMLILNLLMILCCIPVITIGAACTAMHYVLLKIVRDEEGYLVRGFFKSFVRNFKQATIAWLLMLVVIAVYLGDWLIFSYSGIEFPRVLVIAVVAVGAVALLISLYVFPLMARFENTIRNTFKNAAILAFANLPRTLGMAFLYALPLIIGYFSAYSYIFIFMFGISLPAFGAAWMYSGIFKRFEPESEQTSDLDFSVEIEGEGETDGRKE